MQRQGYRYSTFRVADYYAMEVTLNEFGADMSGLVVFEVREVKYLSTMVH